MLANACCVLKKYEHGKGPFFKVLIGEPERLLWSKSCRSQLGPTDFMCSDHFSPKDMISGGAKANLLAKAVPFAPPPCAVSSTPAVKHKFVKSSNIQFCTDMDFSISPPEPSQCLDFNPIDRFFSEMQTDVRFMKFLNDIELSDRRKEVKNLNALNKELNFKLDKANAVINNVKKIFTEGQMRKIIEPDHNIKWADNDISNAMSLHDAGPKAYNHLYENGFPIPHETTLRLWHRKSDISNSLLTVSVECVQHMSELSKDDPLFLPDSADMEE